MSASNTNGPTGDITYPQTLRGARFAIVNACFTLFYYNISPEYRTAGHEYRMKGIKKGPPNEQMTMVGWKFIDAAIDAHIDAFDYGPNGQ